MLNPATHSGPITVSSAETEGSVWTEVLTLSNTITSYRCLESCCNRYAAVKPASPLPTTATLCRGHFSAAIVNSSRTASLTRELQCDVLEARISPLSKAKDVCCERTSIMHRLPSPRRYRLRDATPSAHYNPIRLLNELDRQKFCLSNFIIGCYRGLTPRMMHQLTQYKSCR